MVDKQQKAPYTGWLKGAETNEKGFNCCSGDMRTSICNRIWRANIVRRAISRSSYNKGKKPSNNSREAR